MGTLKQRLAVVGAGLIGRRHITAIALCEHAELAAIVDPAPEAASLAKQHGVPYYADLGQMLETVIPDGVIVATPNHLHVSNGLLCVQANCPVLVEKPISTSALQAQELVQAALDARVPLLVGHHRRYNPLIRQARHMIDNGLLGDIRAVQGTCWLFKPDDYYAQAPWRTKLGAGPVSVNLVHDIDLLRHLVGDIVRVHAMAVPSARGHENEDVAAAVLMFDGGAVGSISVSDAIVAPYSWELTARENPAYTATDQSCYQLGGSHGTLSLPDLKLWRNEGERGWWQPVSMTSFPVDFSDPLLNQIQHFCEVIRGELEPLVSGAEGLATLRVIEAIQHSAKSGETVSL